MITLNEFLKKYLGQSKGYPTDTQYKGECLSIVKLYIKECFGIDPPASGTNSAYGYWSNFPSPLGTVFEKVENSDTLIPLKGWIAIWKPWTTNQYGHISIVADGCTASILKNYAQNWTSKIFQLESNKYTNVKGFLKPKISGDIIEDMTEEQKRILDFLIGKTEGDVRSAFGALADNPGLQTNITSLTTANKGLQAQVDTLTKQIADLKTSLDSLTKQVNDFKTEVTADQKTKAEYQTELETANQTISNTQVDLTQANTDRQKYKNLYEKALTDQVNKYTGWQLIKMGISKLSITKGK